MQRKKKMFVLSSSLRIPDPESPRPLSPPQEPWTSYQPAQELTLSRWDIHFLMIMCACMLSRFSCVWLLATPQIVAYQAPLSLGFPRQEYRSGLPRPPPGDLPDPGIEPGSLASSTLAAAAAKSLQPCPILWPHRRQPTRLPRPWDSPGKDTGAGCHFLFQFDIGRGILYH